MKRTTAVARKIQDLQLRLEQALQDVAFYQTEVQKTRDALATAQRKLDALEPAKRQAQTAALQALATVAEATSKLSISLEKQL